MQSFSFLFAKWGEDGWIMNLALDGVSNFQFEPQKRRGGVPSQARRRPFKQVLKRAADATGKTRVPP